MSCLITLWQSGLTKVLQKAFCAGFTTLRFSTHNFNLPCVEVWKGYNVQSLNDFRCSTFCVVDSPHYFLTSEAALPVAWNTDSKSRRPWEWVRQYKVLWQVILDLLPNCTWHGLSDALKCATITHFVCRKVSTQTVWVLTSSVCSRNVYLGWSYVYMHLDFKIEETPR